MMGVSCDGVVMSGTWVRSVEDGWAGMVATPPLVSALVTATVAPTPDRAREMMSCNKDVTYGTYYSGVFLPCSG